MLIARWLLSWGVACCAALWILGIASIGQTQTTPKIEFLFPAGAQRGTSVDVQFGGDFIPEGSRLHAAGASLSLKASETANRYRFSVSPEAPVGLAEVRLACVQGASSPFPFVIGDLPEVLHLSQREPLELKFPVTANGRLDAAGDIDEYSIALAEGKQIVCAVSTRMIRSPVDAMMRLLDEDRKVVATSGPHRSADSLLVFRASKSGRYTLQVFDFQLAGGADFIYRLTVTDGPWVSHTFPAGVSREQETAVTVFGWNLPSKKDEPFVVKAPPQVADSFELILAGGSQRLKLPVGEFSEIIESEPNDAHDQANELSLPVTINGRLASNGDLDVFSWVASKGQQIVFQVDSADLRFSTDIVLKIFNEAGKMLLEADDAKTSRDPSARFNAAAAGRYFVTVQDRSRRGGEQFIYRLHVSAPRPELTARVNATSLMVHAGQTTNLPVSVERQNGFDEELEVVAVDLPTGVEFEPQAVPAKTPATIQLPIKVAEKTVPTGGLARIEVRSKNTDGKTLRVATIAESATATSFSDNLWIAVSPEIPFTLKTGTTILDAPRMAGFPFPVSVVRKEGFTGKIRLVGVEPDRRGTVVPLAGEIAEASDLGSLPLVLQHKVTEGTTHRCRVMGIAEVAGADGKPYPVFHVAPGSMSIGCQPSLLTMIVEPEIVTFKPGTTQRVEVQLMRRVSMAPVTLKIVVPDGVAGIECGSVDVSMGEDRATLNLRFGEESRLLPKRLNLQVQAESSRDGLPIYGTASFRLETADDVRGTND